VNTSHLFKTELKIEVAKISKTQEIHKGTFNHKSVDAHTTGADETKLKKL